MAPKKFKSKLKKGMKLKKFRRPRHSIGNLGSKSSEVVKSLNFFPLKVLTKLQYVEDFAINTNAVSDATNLCSTTYSYRLTSPYDPRYEVGGSVPLNFTKLQLIYDVYKVVKAFVKVTFYNPTIDGMKCGVRVKPLGDSPTLSLDVIELQENKDTCRVKCINDTGSQIVNFSSWIYPWQILGVSKEQYLGDGIYGGASNSSNPSNYPLLDCFCCTTTSNGAIRCTVSIDYYTILSDRNFQT